MLKFFKNTNNSLTVKIIYCFVILSFCSYGILEFVNSCIYNKCVVKVGRRKITRSQIEDAAMNALRNKKSNPEQEIQNIINSYITNYSIEDHIVNNKIYTGSSEINKIVYQLRKNNQRPTKRDMINIKEYVKIQSFYENNALAFAQHAILPRFIQDAVINDLMSKKKIYIKTIRLKDFKYNEKSVTEEDIDRFYNAHPEKYIQKETRTLDILFVDESDGNSNSGVTDKEINDYYKNNIQSFTKNIESVFRKYTFNSQNNADNAWRMLHKKTTMSEIEKNFAIKTNTITINNKTQNKFHQEILSLGEGEISSIVIENNKYCIYVCEKIKTSKVAPLSDVKQDIKTIIQEGKASSHSESETQSLAVQIDDMIASGKKIKEISDTLKIKYKTISNVEDATIRSELKKIKVEDELSNDIAEKVFNAKQDVTVSVKPKDETTLSRCIFAVTKINPAKMPDKIDRTQVKKDVIHSIKSGSVNKLLADIVSQNEKAIAKIKELGDYEIIYSTKQDIISCYQHMYSEDKKTQYKPDTEAKKFIDICNNAGISYYSGINSCEDYIPFYGICNNSDIVVIVMEPYGKQENLFNRNTNLGDYNLIEESEKSYVNNSIYSAIQKNTKIKTNHKMIDKITANIATIAK